MNGSKKRKYIYNMQLKQKINYTNVITAKLNYKSSMTKLLAINSIMQQNTIQEMNRIRPRAKSGYVFIRHSLQLTHLLLVVLKY